MKLKNVLPRISAGDVVGVDRRKMRLKSSFISAALFVLISFFGIGSRGFAGTLRIVDWNIEADIKASGDPAPVTTPRAGFNTVLQGMGNEIIAGDAQPIDILALEETTSNTTTVQPILNMLNGDYAGANYKMSTVQGGESGNDPTTGNGPNAIVYNANAVQLLASVGVGTPTGSTNGEYRQVMRYEFQPVNGSSAFYIYVSHMKSGTGTSDKSDRGKEATIIRNDEATLPSGASVLYMGDLNAAPSEDAPSPNGEFANLTASGQGQASDPLSFSTSKTNFTDSSTSLRFRDDYQLMTSNVLNGTGAINYISGSLEAFGNNGTTPSSGRTDNAANTDLAYMTTANGYSPTQSQILSALTTASDHLPNVGDYTFTSTLAPEPACLALMIGGILFIRRPSKNLA
jgi:endonuclease/exonuclease/phosphatase family metal-dependent hydrolase